MKKNTIKLALVLFMLLVNVVYLKLCANTTDSIPHNTISYRDYLNTVGKKNLSLLIEKYNIKIADADIIAAKVMPDPELGFEAANETYTVELGYNLELGNKRGARVRLAKSEAELSRLAVDQFFQELRAEATDAYLEAILQRELLDVKQSSYNYMLQLSKSDSIRFTLGEITENDARQSKLEAATLLNEVYQQEAEYKSALVTLNQYMGKPIDSLNIPVSSWNGFDREYILSGLISTATDNRVDLLVAQKNNDVAINQLKLAKAERSMDLGLMVGYERDWKGPFPTRKTVKAGVTVPLVFSNINKGAVKSAKYAIEQSEFEKQNVGLQIQTEVSQAFYQYQSAQKQVKQYQTGLLEESKKILDGMMYRYKRGETSVLDVLIAQRSYNEVQEQYVEIMKGLASSLVTLEKACGIWDIDF